MTNKSKLKKMVFQIEEMIAIIEGKLKAYTDILRNEGAIHSEFKSRIEGKKQICEELLKEYNARK